MAWFSVRAVRPLAGACGLAPLVPFLNGHRPPAQCEKPTWKTATCTRNEAYTHDTRFVTLDLGGGSWTEKGPISNVVVRAPIAAAPELGSCACCKCPPPCMCPKGANGCCACCKCPGTCGCPKKELPASAGGPTLVARPYNPLYTDSGSRVTLLVKKYSGGKMGSKLHGLEVGETVEVRGPNQQWTFEAGKYKSYAMVAGGTGITPLFQAAEHILKHDKGATVTVLTLNKTEGDVLLKDELERLGREHGPRVRVVHRTGMPSAEMLREELPEPSGGSLLVMVCGRPAMTKVVSGGKAPDFSQGELGGLLKELGYKPEQVWKV